MTVSTAGWLGFHDSLEKEKQQIYCDKIHTLVAAIAGIVEPLKELSDGSLSYFIAFKF